jgi:hypothetical protein
VARPRPFCECRYECDEHNSCFAEALYEEPATDVEVYVPAGIFDADLCDPTGADDMVVVSSTLGAILPNGFALRREGILNSVVADYTYNVLDNACAVNPISNMFVASGEYEYLGETQTTFGFQLEISCALNFSTQTSSCVLNLYAEWRDHALLRYKPPAQPWSAPFWQRAGYHSFRGQKSLIKPLAIGDAVTVKGLPGVIADGYTYRDDRQFNSTFQRPGRPLYELLEDAPSTWIIQF